MAVIPQGLEFYSNFLTEESYNRILTWINSHPEEYWQNLGLKPGGRKVRQYGYAYNYSRKGVNSDEEVEVFPDIINELRQLINVKIPEQYELDMCIINRYLPGEGIYPHVDAPKSFEDYICCFTINSGGEMEFNLDTNKYCLYTLPNSLYIMSGDSRYKWSHEMKKRLNDTVDGVKIKRGTRYSITFRTVIKK
jgi:alkylated DNA repair dioxygenase AlkB